MIGLLGYLKALLTWVALFAVFHLLHLDDPASFFLALLVTLIAATTWSTDETDEELSTKYTSSCWAQKLESLQR